MPYLSKKVISQYFRTECKRQLRLDLSPDNATYRPERIAEGMPEPQQPRPGLEHIAQAGEAWQAAKLDDLTNTFGTRVLIGNRLIKPTGQVVYKKISLTNALAQMQASGPQHDAFLIEAEFAVCAAFETALGISAYRQRFNLDYAELRPDIIEVLPPGQFSEYVTPAGARTQLPPGDPREQLCVIDIKLTAEPSPGYFAEVTYYMMALAGWLADTGLDQRYVVVPDGAIWPGSHDASRLTVVARELTGQGATPSIQQLRAALAEDLEPVPFEVFSFRLRRFLQDELPDILRRPWRTLDWHVDNRCQGCEYLGYPWKNAQGQPTSKPDHCMPMAQQHDHLSRVAFISRGARMTLQNQGIGRVAVLAQRSPQDPAFDGHQLLRATRTVISGRAASLATQQSHIPAQSGTSSIMPRWADLRIYLSADFDVGSAITFAFGVKAFWVEPRPFGSPATAQRATKSWQPRVFVVDRKDPQAEQRELTALLDQINTILQEAQALHRDSTVQFYVWDTLQYKHLSRVIGRHLQAILNNATLQRLAWLFPPEELVPNPALVTRPSPITIVGEVVRGMVAAPVSHYYSLLGLARAYHDQGLPPNVAQFSVHPLFEDMLSDQIPSERAHEIWAHVTAPRHWQQQLHILEQTVQRRLDALETVTKRLETDLRPQLVQGAPRIAAIQPPQRRNRLSMDGQLWYAFARLDEALAQLEVFRIRAMPPHEREARFHSTRLQKRLTGHTEATALSVLGLSPAPGRRVYHMRPTSAEVKLREQDFNLALAPEAVSGFLDRLAQDLTQGAGLQQVFAGDWQTKMEDVTGITVAGIDRDRCLIALDPNRRWGQTMLDDIEANGIADLSQDVILDPVHHDFFTRKLLSALEAIGNPPIASARPLVQQATGQLTGRGSRRSTHTPPADVLWDARTLHGAPVSRALQPVRAQMVAAGLDMNPAQWQAWHDALSRRLQLIWGPPGTGKSRTARAIVVGAALEAAHQGNPLRVLVSASTYNAIDIVLLEVYRDLTRLLPPSSFEAYRVRSYLQPVNPQVPTQIDMELNKRNPSAQVLALRKRLQRAFGITIVGAPPEQVHNLLVANCGSAQQELFDLILLDEASQMDVAHGILALCAIARGGSVVVAGDPQQLPPIHQAEPPLGLESMVGSIYAFFHAFQQVPHVMLNENYRSGSSLVDFAHHAGYRSTLTSFSPDLRLNYLSPLPATQPPNWPVTLHWTPEWSAMLDPDEAAICFVYPEGTSSQWNQFEADAVAALVTILHGRLADQLTNERDPATGTLRPASSQPYAPPDFWKQAVGVVTPHRAQQGLIVSRLRQIFGSPGVSTADIRGAVDTVERFQGQQRDVIIASFALGDPDAIQDEDEFLMSLNRFNVMASRARAKLIVLVSREVIDHLSSDLDTLRQSRLLKVYANAYCNNIRPMTLGYQKNGQTVAVNGLFCVHR